MSDAKKALEFLGSEVEKKRQAALLSFQEYLEYVCKNSHTALRSIFRLFYDMVKGCVGEEDDGHPNDPESIGFIKYDCSKLLVKGADNPFFADRLFANRLIRQVESLHQGFQQNRVYSYEGPSGCGKSTFLNNLLRTFEAYTGTKEGRSYEVLWEIDEGIVLKASNVRDVLIHIEPHDHA